MQKFLGWYVHPISIPYIVHWRVDIAKIQIENGIAHIQFITNRGTKPVLVAEEVHTFLSFGWILEVCLVSGWNRNINIEPVLFTWSIKSNKPYNLDTN
jgi:hypothetical protein